MRNAILTLCFTFAALTGASADPLVLSDFTGGFGNPLDTSGGQAATTLLSTSGLRDTVAWGLDDKSFFHFDRSSGASLTEGLVELGTFTHENNKIFKPSLLSTEYDLQFSLNDPGHSPIVLPTVSLGHHETPPMAQSGCPYGFDANGCFDRVSFQIGDGVTPFVVEEIVVGNMTYIFQLLGFAAGDGYTYDGFFSTAEMSSNSTGLWGIIAMGDPVVPPPPPPTPVPEPATLALLGTGLAALALRTRRRGR